MKHQIQKKSQQNDEGALKSKSSGIQFLSSVSRRSQSRDIAQFLQAKGGLDSSDVQQTASEGVKGSGEQLPHMGPVQESFGKHDVSNVQAHTDSAATQANEKLGSVAYATGDQVAFKGAPDLHTTAHEAAHVVQQRGGVSLKDGIGQVGDQYEQHADAVADKVVQGKSAESLLSEKSGGTGNSGTQQKSLQYAEEASNTTEASAIAPKGPLADLKKKLEQSNVPEEECLTLIGQLGSGERQLVADDATMMQEMGNAFNAKEMLKAVDLLDCKLKWAIHWLKKAGEEDNIGPAGYGRLLGSADSQETAEMVGWESVRATVAKNYDASPLSLPALVVDKPKMVHVIKTYTNFSTWVKSKAGIEAYANFAAANNTADILSAIRTVGWMATFLSDLRSSPAGPQLHGDLFKMFKATTDSDERKKLFEARFQETVKGNFDWIVKGEDHWNQRLTVRGEVSDEQIEKDIKAGKGPTDVAGAIKADPDGALEKLQDELDDTCVDEEYCLKYMGQLSALERYLVRKNDTLMGYMADAFNADEMIKGLRLLAFPEPKWAIYWLKKANEHSSVAQKDYENIIFAASSQNIAELVGWKDMFDIVKQYAKINPLGIPALMADDAKMAHIFKTYSYFVDWALQNPGAQMLLRYIAAHTPATLAPALKDGGKLNGMVDKLPTGSTLAQDDQKALFEIFKVFPNFAEKKILFAKRFNVKVGKTSASDFEALGFTRVWQLLERLPPTHVADNKWLAQINRKNGGVCPSGVTGGSPGYNRVGMGYDPTHMGDGDTGEFTDGGDVLRNENLFDAVLIHEMGHAADNQYDFSGSASPLATKDTLGAWKEYRSDSSAAAETLLGDMLSASALTGLTDPEKVNAKKGLKKAIRDRNQNAEVAFKALGTAAGDAWSVGKTWYDLWQKVKAHGIVKALDEGHLTKVGWNNPPTTLGTRKFHQSYSKRWTSYLSAFRGGQKLSRYQFRNRREFFAEIYAVYYMTPNDPGSKVKTWNNDVYNWFVKNVDKGFGTKKKP